MRALQVEVFRCTRIRLGDTAAIDFPGPSTMLRAGHSVLNENRHHDTPVEVFVSGLPDQAQRLQPVPDLRPGLAVRLRDPQAQRPVGEAVPEPLGRLLLPVPPAFQVLHRRRCLQESLVVVVQHLGKEF